MLWVYNCLWSGRLQSFLLFPFLQKHFLRQFVSPFFCSFSSPLRSKNLPSFPFIIIIIIIIIIINYACFSPQFHLLDFHWFPIDIKSPQVYGTLLSILADLKIVVSSWSRYFLFSRVPQPHFGPLGSIGHELQLVSTSPLRFSICSALF